MHWGIVHSRGMGMLGWGVVLLGLLRSVNSGSRRCDVNVALSVVRAPFRGVGSGCEIGVSRGVKNGHGS